MASLKNSEEWKELWNKYPDQWFHKPEFREEVLSFLSNLQIKDFKALDAGSGKGHYSNDLRILGCKDIKKIDLVPLTKDTIKSPIEKTPFEDNKFDLVMCILTLEHSSNIKGAIDEFHRIIKDGGYLLVAVPKTFSLAGIHVKFQRVLRNGMNLFIPYHHTFTKRKILRLFRGKFRLIKYKEIGVYKYQENNKNKLIRLIDEKIKDDIILLAQKYDKR